MENQNTARRLKIAYLTVNDPMDKRSWSGITYYLAKGLERNVGDVEYLGPVKTPWLLDKILIRISKTIEYLFKINYDTKFNLLSSWYAARVLKKRMKGRQFDCIVSPATSWAFAFFKTDLPSAYVSDTTFELISNYYKKEFWSLSKATRWEGNLLERRSLQKADFIIHSSHWAKNSAVDFYKIDPEKILVRPLGANMDHVPSRDMIFEKEKNGTLTLLFLAVDWDRKGGSIAFDTLVHLHEMGVSAKLVVCGSTPPEGFSHPHMKVIPFLNKNNKEDHDLFVHLLSTSHFLILPTRADCSLLVACESNAYGMPAVATATGGVPDVVIDGVNGYCLPNEAQGPAYAELIAEIYRDKERYHRLIQSSRDKYERELNWDQWARDFMACYEKFVLKKESVRTNAPAQAFTG